MSMKKQLLASIILVIVMIMQTFAVSAYSQNEVLIQPSQITQELDNTLESDSMSVQDSTPPVPSSAAGSGITLPVPENTTGPGITPVTPPVQQSDGLTILAAAGVTDLTAVADVADKSITLTWANPTLNFYYAVIHRSIDDGVTWEGIEQTNSNTYTDTYATYFRTYKYRVIAVFYGNTYDLNPPEVTAQLIPAQPIILAKWETDNNGKVNSNNVGSYGISANFNAEADIVSIEYELSADNVSWNAIDKSMIKNDYGLEYVSYDNAWRRNLYLDFTSYEHESFWIKGTATDKNGATFFDVKEFSRDLICEDAADFTALPNAENTALVLSWSAPADFDHAEIYKEYYNYGWRWGWEANVTGTSYTDTEVNKDNPYISYRYKVIMYDKSGNKSTNPPIISGNLNTPGPIAFREWYLSTTDGKINQYYSSGYTITTSFYSVKPISSIQYKYSLDGSTWLDMTPFISSNNGVQRDQQNGYSYCIININIGPQSGIPDGDFHIQAVCTDPDANTLTETKAIVKDATPPANVTNITAVPNEDNTAIVLNWINPADMSYIIIERDGSYISPSGYNLDTYTDNNVKTGQEYTYKFYVYDSFDNKSVNPPTIDAVLPTGVPALESMLPENNYLTKDTTINYYALFRSDIGVSRIVFEASRDGMSWILLKDKAPDLYYDGYRLSGDWDVSQMEEEEWSIRATAYDTAGETTSEVRTVVIDHKAPPVPAGFKAEITSVSPYTILLTWDAVDGADKYYLSRYYANPDDGYYPSQLYVNAPAVSYSWSSGIYAETPYTFKLQSVDKAGNMSTAVAFDIEIFTGPEIILENGYDYYTNNSSYPLSGTVTPGAEVTVNGNITPVGADGKFTYTATLSTQINNFTIIAAKDGVTHTVGQRVTYDTTAPTVNFYPYDNSLLQGKSARITISTSDNISEGIAKQVLQVSKDDGATWLDVLQIPYGQSVIYWDTTADIGGTGALADGAYKFRLMVWDKAGNSTNGNPVRIWKIDNTKPEPPASLAAVQETGKIKLSWLASTSPDLDASSIYWIYRSTISGSMYTNIGSTSNTSYDDTGVTAGNTYYYVVTAKDAAGNESNYSSEVSASPVEDTTAPVFTTAPSEGKDYGGKEVRIYLSATDDSPKGVSKFKLEYSGDSGVTWQTHISGVSSSTSYDGKKSYYVTFYLNTAGMISGSYIFRFSAIDYSGNTTIQERNLNIDTFVEAVSALSATSGEGTIILQWSAGVGNDIYYYDIYRSTYYSGGFNKINTLTNKTATSYTDINVVTGSTYYYKIITRDAYSNESESGVVSAAAHDDITPPVITDVNIAESALIGGKLINLSVSATDNKKPVSIDFSGSQDGGATWKPLQVSLKSSNLQSDNITYKLFYDWTTTGFTSGEIKVKMTAKDAAGNAGTFERTWNLDLFVTPPSNLRATPGDGSILIEWDAVTDADIYSYPYSVFRSLTSGGPYILLSGNLYAQTLKYTDTGTEAGKTYYYVVQARDKFGNESRSAELEAKPAVDDIPPYIDSFSPVNGTTVGGDTYQRLTVYFSDNAGKTGATAAIEYSPDGENWLPVSNNITGPLDYSSGKYQFYCNWRLTDLTSGNYKVRYTVCDGTGNTASQTVDYYVDRTGPSAPENLLAAFGESSIGLVWELPPELDTEYYHIYRSNTVDGTYEYITRIDGRESNIYSDNTVQLGVTYFYKVTAFDEFDQEGAPSNIASAAAEADSFPPIVISIEPAHHTVLGANAHITVTAKDNTALSSITLEYDDGTGWKAISTIVTLGTAIFNWQTKPLFGNVQVRAIARDSAGNTSDGSVYRAYTIDNIGPSITGLRGSSFGGDIVLEWDSVPDADLDYFLVEMKDSLGRYQEQKKVYSILGCNVSSLEPSTDYWFRVTAFDKLGNPGEPAELMVNSGSDNTPPTVMYIYSDFDIYSGNSSILITPFKASDNVMVKKLILEFSSNGTDWIQISERTLDIPVREVSFNETWDVSALGEGDYFVRAIAVDEAGNISQPSEDAVYTVDHTMPAAPDNVTLSSTAGYIEVKWNYTAGTDFGYFKLWRSEAEAGPYVNVAPAKYTYKGYRDRNVVNGKTYYYKVTVVDAAENESDFSGIVSGSLTADTNPPYIYLSEPLEGDILNFKAYFDVAFTDDLALKSMRIEYQPDNAVDDSWNLIRFVDYNPDGLGSKTYALEEFYWENTGIPEGWYKVSITVTDSAGNVTGPLIMRCCINNVAPEQPVLSAEPGGWQVSLNWSSADKPADFSSYKVYKTDVLGGSPYNIGKTSGNSFIDKGVQPGIRYYYCIRAYDIYGNYSQSETLSAVPTNEDKILPVANAGDDHILTTDMEGLFDGTLSGDNDRIASYLWDFGDGSTAVTAQPTHAYTTAGSYTATLTVTDPAGNTASDSASVKVVPVDEVGILEVKVIDDITGELLPGSSVVIDFPDGATWKTGTNSVGAAFVVAPPGDYEIYAYKTDFKPASMKVTMVRGQKSTIMIRLPKGSVVTGELKAERMNIDEIIAAGIDVTDPANQTAYKFDIGLCFSLPSVPIIITKERIIRPLNSPDEYEFSEDGNRIIIRQRTTNGGDGEEDDGNTIYLEILDLPGDVPALAYMVIPGKTTWLKEFFDISLTIQNAADPEYVIENAWARLSIPDGLSLAPTREGQHEYIDMGSISGGESKSISWIIRGDKKGEYTLEAEFNSVLMPFEDEIKQIFRNDEPFRIWANDALTMHIITQDRADKGYPYKLRMGMENVSDVPVYNGTLELLEETKQNYIYAPNQELAKTVPELKAGETIWQDYYLVSAIDGLLVLDNSGVLKTGGDAEITQDISSIAVPENSPGIAPVLNQVNGSDGKVRLSWGAVEGATGYKIYRIREDLLMSLQPELVYTCGSEVLSVVLDEPNGPRDYIINTLTAEGEIMRHAITGLSWIENAAGATLAIDPEIIIAGLETEILVTARKGGFPVKNGWVNIRSLAASGTLDLSGQARIIVKPLKEGPIEVELFDESGLLIKKTIQAVLPEVPRQPSGLKAEIGNRKVVLTWFPNSEPALKGYYVYQIRNNSWIRINSEILEGTSLEVTGLHDNTKYTFQVSAMDMFNMESIPSEPLQVKLGISDDVTAPWVIGTGPANQAVDVLRNTDIRIYFSENVALHRTYENIQVAAGGQNVEFEPLTDENILTLTLKEPLPVKTRCTVTIPTGAIRDKYFNELSSDYILNFFTETEKDNISPSLAAVSPKDNMQQVSVHSSIYLYFSEEVVKGNTFGNILLTANGSSVAHSIEFTGSKIIIKPLEALPYSSKVQIFIPAGAVADSGGNISAGEHTLTFYTDTTPDLLSPKAIRMEPHANSMNVSPSAEINMFFSERIKQGEFYGDIALTIDGQLVASVISIEGNVLKIKPSEKLLPKKTYHALVPAGALSDLSGNLLPEKTEADFVTGEYDE